MRLKLDRPLVILDLETTGLRIGVDRIVQLAARKLKPDGSSTEWQTLVNPEMPIPQRSTDVHGITNAMVEGFDTFVVIGQKLAMALDGCDVAGFNVRRFDWPFLLAEFARVGVALAWEPRIIDAMAIYRAYHPRDLEAALMTYCGRVHDGAHHAMSDVIATHEVLDAQLERHDLPDTVSAVEEMFTDPDEIDMGGKFKFEGDVATIAFGKHAGTPLAKLDRGFLEWMLRGDFAPDAKRVARDALSGRYPTKTKGTK